MRAKFNYAVGTLPILIGLMAIGGCAPEVGSERWCDAMRDKPRGDWSTNEALDYTRYCIFKSDDDE